MGCEASEPPFIPRHIYKTATANIMGRFFSPGDMFPWLIYCVASKCLPSCATVYCNVIQGSAKFSVVT